MSRITKTYFLRDAIHSDIAFEGRFFALISTAEFQRLARIKQLSSEYLVFPTAVHNRFSHSIGTFYVMGRLIERLESVLKDHQVEVTPEQKDLALCSALLHDIGHGPFSHSFESILGTCSHEEWSRRILSSPDTEIHRALRDNFSEGFVEKLIKILKGRNDPQDNIISLISQLISSQMDADRMDYLLRDSYFTGVSTGIYDLNRLIEAIDVTRLNGRLTICVREKYISSIEEYIMARFYMHKEAYQHPLKRQLEHIIRKIFERAGELYFVGRELNCDRLMQKLFEKDIRLSEYLQMDDAFLMYHIASWRSSDDFILSELSRAFVDRKKYSRYRSQGEGERLIDRLNSLIAAQGGSPIDWQKEYCYIDDTISIPIYNRGKDNIWVKKQDGEAVDIAEASYLLKNLDMRDSFVRENEYYHEKMLAGLHGIEL